MAHTCHATDCKRDVPPSMFMCGPHWRRVPRPLQQRIWETYRKGQEEDKMPSADYCRAAREAVVWVAQLERRTPDTALYDMYLIGAEQRGNA